MANSSGIQTILVPLDGSVYGERAMPWALAVAGDSARLVLLEVVPEAHEVRDFLGRIVGTDSDIQRAYLDKARGQLTDARERWCRDRDNVDLVVGSGDPIAEILRIAASEEADIIVMCSHGHGAVGRFVSGSTADEVVRTAPLPVMVVGPDGDSSPRQIIRRVLLPVDGSDHSQQAIPFAEKIAKQSGAEILVVTVVTPVMDVTDSTGSEMTTDLLAENMKQASDYVSIIVHEIQKNGLTVDGEVISGDMPASLTSSLQPGDILVMTSQSHRRLHRWTLGSNTMKLIRNGHAPVVVLNREYLDAAQRTDSSFTSLNGS